MWIKRFEKPMQTIMLYKSLIKHIWFISCLVTDAEPKKHVPLSFHLKRKLAKKNFIHHFDNELIGLHLKGKTSHLEFTPN